MSSNTAKPFRFRLNLKLVATVDFRRGVPFHYDELKRRKILRDIAEDETICLISQTGLQVAFVFHSVQIEGRGGDPVTAIGHYRVQLDRHCPWNHKMLSVYAERAGIELLHVKRFEEHLDSVRDAA